ncbi:hypothetical protein HIM_07198 [Hirsutella minnesotensis 3608]|uniref:Integral membrane protein n=1 Tax=Hirsutella minnesotensis 3608 TaxID=1043627 RepID=A0A0F8A4D8_9HYPO|nr:hypothetical protein HIM_07198 [Hirsutella minnesotensis 3608]
MPAADERRCATTTAPVEDQSEAVSKTRPASSAADLPVAEKRASSSSDVESPIPSDASPVKLAVARDGQIRFAPGSRLLNNLSWVVGCLELANAGDFAANVWNQVPIPIYAIVLMAIGGTVAGVMCLFAFADSRHAWHNIQFLRRQRCQLLDERARCREGDADSRALDILLCVSFREVWSEIINRWAMDILMGCGAVFISAGTYMAIAGANPAVWQASNLLSGYLGNSPMALFALVNSSWAIYIWSVAQAHVRSSHQHLAGSRAAALVKRRSRNLQLFYAINGTASIVGGVGSMLTATYWWGYVLLIPVIISSIFCNLWWRHRTGYTRSRELPPINPTGLATGLEFAAKAEALLREEQPASPLQAFVPGHPSLSEVLAFLRQNGLGDALCLDVASDPKLRGALGLEHVSKGAEFEVGLDHLASLPAAWHLDLLRKADECISREGPMHFRNRERHLAELLGTCCSMVGKIDFEEEDSSEKHG